MRQAIDDCCLDLESDRLDSRSAGKSKDSAWLRGASDEVRVGC